MSVTVHQKPPARYPLYNPNVFLALSNNIAQPNFLYRVILTDVDTSTVIGTFDCSPDPDGYLKFDAGPYVDSYIDNFSCLPINTYGWQLIAGTRKIRINIGEYYGTTPAYVAGSNYDWITWNCGQDYLDIPGFDINQFLYDDLNTNYVYLTSSVAGYTYANRSDMLYVLTKTAGDLKYLYIDTYNAAGGFIGTSIIANPYQASFVYTDKYIGIDVGYKGLLNISAGLVTGVFPIITNSVASYNVSETNSSATPPVGRLIKSYTIGCEPRFDVYTLHFLRKNGAFQTVHFNKRSDFELKKEETTYKQFPWTRSGFTYGYSRSKPTEKVLSTKVDEVLKLNTNYLTNAEVAIYEELFSSPIIYLDLGSTLSYPVVFYVPGSFKKSKPWNELYQLQADFRYSHSNYRQRV